MFTGSTELSSSSATTLSASCFVTSDSVAFATLPWILLISAAVSVSCTCVAVILEVWSTTSYSLLAVSFALFDSILLCSTSLRYSMSWMNAASAVETIIPVIVIFRQSSGFLLAEKSLKVPRMPKAPEEAIEMSLMM